MKTTTNFTGHGGKWFDQHGYFHGDIPQECVSDCNHPGQCDADVEFWTSELGFSVPREKAIIWLSEFGAWDLEELNEKQDNELAEIVLWLACGDIKANGEWLGLVH
jgi:hypothetical protein